MKIEQNQPHTVVPVGKTLGPKKAEKGGSDAKLKNERQGADAMRGKMTQWFAKAGVTPVMNNGFDTDISKRLTRHQQVKAQRKMANLETILGLALDFSLEQSQSEELDPDWFFSFVEMAEEVNSPAMQELWGKIFAVEISRPGTFSLSTLQILKRLTQKDAQIFKTAVSLASRKKGEYTPRLVFGYHQRSNIWSVFNLKKDHYLNLAEFGLAYPNLLSLMNLGLIYNSEIESGELNTESRSQWRVGKQSIHLAPKRKGLTLHYYKFTATGSELFKLVSGSPNIQYMETLKATLSKGFDIN